MDLEWQQTKVDIKTTKVSCSKIFSRYWKYITIICLTGIFFIVELVIGIIIQSLAVQADAIHMLSDLMAQIIALISFRLTFLPNSEKATFGYKRADVIGGMINGIFLFSVCFFITLEAIQRFANLQEVAQNFGDVNVMLIIGCVGVAVNIFGIIIFMFECKKKHKHDDHHNDNETNDSHSSDHSHDHGHNHGHSHGHSHGDDDNHDMNIKFLLLHMVGDVLGSISVIICSLIIKFADGNMKYIADPIASIIVVIILLFSAIPITKRCYNILIQAVPIDIDLSDIKRQLFEIEGVMDIHDFHIWKLSGKKNIGSLHIKIAQGISFHDIINKVQIIMHNNGIHATTIQPEISEIIPIHRESCNDLICDNKKCKDNHCCE